MKKRKWKYNLILVLFYCLAIHKEIFAFDPKDYPQNTIKINRIVQWNSRDKSASPDSVILVDVSGVPFSTTAIYLHEKRKVDTTITFLLKIVQDSRKDFGDPFHTEIKIKDHDGLVYWVPIQDALSNQFENEVGPCGKVTLYLLWFAGSKN